MTGTDITALVERLRKQAWQRSGAPKMDAGHVKMLEWQAADALEALQGDIEDLRALVSEWRDIRAPKIEAERDGIRLDLNDCNNERVSWKARAEKAEAALHEIARIRTNLSGDFSVGSRQSDIARRALAGDKPQAGQIQQGREAQFQNSLLKPKDGKP